MVPQDGVGAGLVVAVGAFLLEAERSDLAKLFIIVGVPDDLFGHVLANFMLDSADFVQPLLVVQNGLQGQVSQCFLCPQLIGSKLECLSLSVQGILKGEVSLYC